MLNINLALGYIDVILNELKRIHNTERDLYRIKICINYTEQLLNTLEILKLEREVKNEKK